MKKLLYLAPILTLMLLLTGCGKKDVTPEVTTTQPGGSTVEDAKDTNKVSEDTDTSVADEGTENTNTDDTGNVIDPSLKIKVPPIVPINPADDGVNAQLKDPIVKPIDPKVTLPADPIGPIPPLEKNNLPQL
jgi:hypothetical protein